jgi:hypothetical protein
VISCGTALLITTAVVVALRERRQPLPLLEVPVAVMPTEVRVRAVGRKAEPLEQEIVAASYAVAIVCGDDVAADRRATPQQKAELKRLSLALCGFDANPAARVAAIQLAGERGYGEALPVLRKELSSPRRDAVIDIVAIGSVGLLGDSSDIPRLSHFIKHDSRRAPAAEAAIRRINEGSGVK